MKKAITKTLTILFYFIVGVSLFVDTVIRSLAKWFGDTFGVSFEEIIYTIKSPLKGADTGFLGSAVSSSLPDFIVFIFLLIIVIQLSIIDKNLNFSLIINKFQVPVLKVILFSILVCSSLYAASILKETISALEIDKYISYRQTPTHFYEENYVFPNVNSITSDSPKNLIHIYLESMETTYASVEDGGYQPVNNYIPHLTDLAHENISFSNSDKLGGYVSTEGTGWTIAAMFSTESGIPFMFPVEGNSDFSGRLAFASGTVTLGDILEQKGYYQEFLCGSDATFGGREAFFTQHGNFEIFDVDTALEKGYITEKNEWWGAEDSDLYQIAKDELSRVSEMGRPFNLTILTVDTHHVKGWICKKCDNKYPKRLANVLECADNQIYDFVEWCKGEPWFNDTVIVIHGDHPRMDKSLVKGIEYFDRTVYNCFINSVNSDMTTLCEHNRVFTPMDMYPTILSSMGFSIPDNRLGLGTDMFSGEETLSEKYGIEYIDTETRKYSEYYLNTFS